MLAAIVTRRGKRVAIPERLPDCVPEPRYQGRAPQRTARVFPGGERLSCTVVMRPGHGPSSPAQSVHLSGQRTGGPLQVLGRPCDPLRALPHLPRQPPDLPIYARSEDGENGETTKGESDSKHRPEHGRQPTGHRSKPGNRPPAGAGPYRRQAQTDAGRQAQAGTDVRRQTQAGVHILECSLSVLTPPLISNSTMRSPAGLRTASPQSGQVKE